MRIFVCISLSSLFVWCKFYAIGNYNLISFIKSLYSFILFGFKINLQEISTYFVNDTVFPVFITSLISFFEDIFNSYITSSINVIKFAFEISTSIYVDFSLFFSSDIF